MRELLEKMLAGAGYTIHTCAGGIEALDYYAHHHAEIKLVILDMDMPVKNGSETFSGMKAINPKARILISSGYSIKSGIQELIEAGASGFIPKPYRVHELLGKIAVLI